MAYDKEFKKSKEYKNLIKNNPGSEGTVQEFLNAGITDVGQMEKAMKGSYSTQEAIAYMQMAGAKGCPDSILYDETKFNNYLKTTLGRKNISKSETEKIRKGIIAFK